jgi:hypothetical protein
VRHGAVTAALCQRTKVTAFQLITNIRLLKGTPNAIKKFKSKKIVHGC